MWCPCGLPPQAYCPCCHGNHHPVLSPAAPLLNVTSVKFPEVSVQLGFVKDIHVHVRYLDGVFLCLRILVHFLPKWLSSDLTFGTCWTGILLQWACVSFCVIKMPWIYCIESHVHHGAVPAKVWKWRFEFYLIVPILFNIWRFWLHFCIFIMGSQHWSVVPELTKKGTNEINEIYVWVIKYY